MPFGGNWPGSNRGRQAVRPTEFGSYPVYCRPASVVARERVAGRIKRLAARHAVSDRTYLYR